MKVHKHKHKH